MRFSYQSWLLLPRVRFRTIVSCGFFVLIVFFVASFLLLHTISFDSAGVLDFTDLENKILNMQGSPPEKNRFFTTKNYCTGPKCSKPQLVYVACGDDFRTLLASIKSLLVFNSAVDLIIFADEAAVPNLHSRLSVVLNGTAGLNTTLTLREAGYPSNIPPSWRSAYKPCATLRLLLPTLLPDVDAILYLDTDVLIFGSVRELWAEFDQFNETQYLGLTKKLPKCDTKGHLMSSIILMNLTRMRLDEWEKKIQITYEEAVAEFRFGASVFSDQAVLIHHRSDHYETMRIVPCRWLHLQSYCATGCCHLPKYRGFFLHGGGGIFLAPKSTAYHHFYRIFAESGKETAEAEQNQDLTPEEVKQQISAANFSGPVGGHGACLRMISRFKAAVPLFRS